MVRVEKKLKQRAQSGAWYTITMVVLFSMKPRVSVALALRENVVRSDGTGLGYEEGFELFG